MSNKNWLRHLNPFYFEVKYLITNYWVSVGCGILLILFSAFLQIAARPLFLNISSMIQSHIDEVNKADISERAKDLILGHDRRDLHFFNEMVSASDMISCAAVLFAFYFFINASYSRRAYFLIKNTEK